jgi:hypothetical protein
VGGQVPVGVGVIDADERLSARRGRVGVGVVGVCLEYKHVGTGAERKVEAHTRLFNAGGVSLGNGVEFGGGAKGAVTAVACFAGTVGLKAVGPVLVEDDRIRGGPRWGNRTCLGEPWRRVACIRKRAREARW